MQGLDQVLGASGMDIGALASRFGLDPEQARSAMGALVPAVAGGFQKHADRGASTTITPPMGEPDAASGNAILGQIFGSKDVSREVAGHAAGRSGVSSTILKAMLPVVAAMVAKHVAGGGSSNGAGGLGGLLGSVLGGGNAGLGGGFGAGAGGNPLDAILEGLGRR